MINNGTLYKVIDYYSQLANKEIDYQGINNGESEDLVFSRLERAIGDLNETKLESATASRLAIWIADMIWFQDESLKEMRNGNIRRAEELMNISKRALVAYSECCLLIDSQDGGMKFSSEKEILDKYNFED